MINRKNNSNNDKILKTHMDITQNISYYLLLSSFKYCTKMYSRLFCLKRTCVVFGITLVLINFHIVINSPNSLKNIFDMGYFINSVSTVVVNKTINELDDPNVKKTRTSGTGNLNINLICIISIIDCSGVNVVRNI